MYKNRKNEKTLQPFILDAIATTDSFTQKLCKAFLSADILLEKLDYTVLRNFLTEVTEYTVPSASSTRKVVTQIYDKLRFGYRLMKL